MKSLHQDGRKTELFPVTSPLVSPNCMPRSLLISLKDGRGFKTYGVKKVQTSMKFSFIICFVIALARCECVEADSRIFNDLKYLEYLNDLDRRNVEMDDIHGQWPFHQITADREDEDRNEPDESNPDPENLMKIEEFVNLARAEMVNRHHQNYRDSLLDRIEKGYKHLKDTSDRANQLSQYLRYKTPSDIEEILEDVRMYPQENDFTFKEEDVKDLEDNNFFQNANDFIIDDEQEATDEIEPQSSETFYAKPIKPVERSTVNTLDTNEEPVINNAMHHHDHDDYQFKEGEEFSDLIEFNKIPMADDPREFGVGPSDPRYYRDSENEEPKTITALPKLIKSKEADPPRPHPTAKVKLSARTDALQQAEHIPVYHDLIRGSFDKDVKVVPFKPDEQTDTAGVYIIAVVAGISAAATVGLIAVGIGWYNLQKHMKNAEDTDYPSYGIVGPNKDYEKKERDDIGDRRLAQSAQMYHYQHQKQQIIAMGRNPQGHGSQSDTEEEEDEEGNYTVYECPGLASIEGPLEVKNPMFDDDQLATPQHTPSKSTKIEDSK